LLERFPNAFLCGGPHLSRVAEAKSESEPALPGESVEPSRENAVNALPRIQQDPAVYHAILRHMKLEGLSHLSDNDKATIYREAIKLGAMALQPEGDDFGFLLAVLVNGNRPKTTATKGQFIRGTFTIGGKIIVTETMETFIAGCEHAHRPHYRQ
jgi:hypothetical protein